MKISQKEINRRISKGMKKTSIKKKKENFLFRDSEIRRHYAEGKSVSDLRDIYKLSRQGIYDIINKFFA